MSRGREEGECICLSHLLKKPQFPLTSLSLGVDHTPTPKLSPGQGHEPPTMSLHRGSHLEGLLKQTEVLSPSIPDLVGLEWGLRISHF